MIVKPLEKENQTAAGIILIDNGEPQARGHVLAIGDGKVLEDGTCHKMSVKVGDEVIFQDYASFYIEVNGEKLKMMREVDVLCIVNHD